ncbi:DNA-directed RNA polymerase specialized sigma24 family protein [Glaciihabitans sp. UYNi722]
MTLISSPPPKPYKTTDELLVGVARGEREAFAEFYDLTAPRVLGLIRRVMRDPAQSEESPKKCFWSCGRRRPGLIPARAVLCRGR